MLSASLALPTICFMAVVTATFPALRKMLVFYVAYSAQLVIATSDMLIVEGYVATQPST